MKKVVSLIKAVMSSDMNIFKIKSKNGKKNKGLVLLVSFCFMFAIWSYANMLLEGLAPLHLQYIALSLFMFLISLLTVIQGIYKSGSLLFNCKDDQLLLSLPIKRSTVVFVRIFKFYVFELLFDTLFMIPLVIAYLRWADSFNYLFFISSILMLLFMPIIPIIISCIIGVISSSITSRFKHKNLASIIISIIFLLGVFYYSYSLDNILENIFKHANSINEIITKIYYPSGVYANLVTNFNIKDLLLYIIINIVITVAFIFILNKIYFKINSRLKKVITSNKTNIGSLKIKTKSVIKSLISKEVKTFFNIPVFIINAGFGLVLYIIAVLYICIKFDSMIPILTDKNTLNISLKLINSNLSIIIFGLLSATAYMTSITNSLISLEGRNINILKSLPISTKTILLSKILSGLALTTPVFVIGNIILFIRFNISFIDMILLLSLYILIPLVSHFVGLIINLKFPKLDFDNPTEVVKQSMSSFIAVMIGMILFVVSIVLISKIIGKYNATLILFISFIIYLVIDYCLYLYLTKISVKEFNKLTV
ncbi:MAG: hypothetical protein IKH54_06420 [Bacilli bacterium]|nr:hypothetical protein [Bacilli bacterium]